MELYRFLIVQIKTFWITVLLAWWLWKWFCLFLHAEKGTRYRCDLWVDPDPKVGVIISGWAFSYFIQVDLHAKKLREWTGGKACLWGKFDSMNQRSWRVNNSHLIVYWCTFMNRQNKKNAAGWYLLWEGYASRAVLLLGAFDCRFRQGPVPGWPL